MATGSSRPATEDVSGWRFVPAIAPWIATANIGDLVIRDAILARLAASQIFISEAVPTHEQLPRAAAARLGAARTIIVGGSNLLSTRGRRDTQWPLPRYAVDRLRGKLVLCGVGWRVASMDPKDVGTSLWPQLLDPSALHSVRDGRAAAAMQHLGLRYTLTGCPSLLYVPAALGPYDTSTAVVTVTDYNPDLPRDIGLLHWAESRFPRVFLQPQNQRDADYAVESLGLDRSSVLPRDLDMFTSFLRRHRPVYVGTRLHGGIRAMQIGLPTVILGIDNRAVDLGSEFGLNIAADVNQLDSAVDRAFTRVWLNAAAVESRMAEFVEALRATLHREPHES
jgi:hypothetical protein